MSKRSTPEYETYEVGGKWFVDLNAPLKSKQRGFRTPKALPEKQQIEVFCFGCGHRAMVRLARGTIPKIKCSVCGTAGPVSDFVRPRGKQISGDVETLP
jgi:LSD1 subclass zinc finger protein